MGAATGNREIIDFSDERRRHGEVLGREALLRELDARSAQAFSTGGWLLVQGGPGMGKSALLSRWLGSLEAPRWPHHFIRRGVEDWDQPGTIAASLAAQVEARFEEQAEPETDPVVRLPALLRRVSQQVLVPGGQTLVLVVDGLDEASGDGAHNPLPRFLPALLPPRVVVLCASRPDYPRLEWLLAQRPLSIVDVTSNIGGTMQFEIRRFSSKISLLANPPVASYLEQQDEQARHCERSGLPISLRDWLDQQGLWPQNQAKPPDPKAAVLRATRAFRSGNALAIYQQICQRVSVRGCQEVGFLSLRAALLRWFPAAEGGA